MIWKTSNQHGDKRLGLNSHTFCVKNNIQTTCKPEARGIKDIIIPQALEDAMSKQAQAERERQARIILGTAETEIEVLEETTAELLQQKFDRLMAKCLIQYKGGPNQVGASLFWQM